MFKIARELLEAEHERLMRDHYDDLQDTGCPGCHRAGDVRVELAQLSKASHEGRYAHVDLSAGAPFID